ncbi:MAG: hypothetical protein JWO31_944 [Phycisphaerales bacterium]|nr:hypothetical protein [Phycisphaerales bacterium]
MDSLQGQLLIATPRLSDPNFFHTVILLVQHGAEGALGVVLNRPLTAPVRQVWEQVSDAPCLVEGVVHQGGPCEGPLMVVHGDADSSDLRVGDGLHFSTDKDAIERLVSAGEAPTRFFIGYAGWGAGQLEAELAADSWLVLPAEPDHVFEEAEDLWQDLHRAATRASRPSWIPPEIMPGDPSLN